VGFICLLAFILSPSFGGGRNGLQYVDDAFNSLSKGSAYFVPDVAREVAALGDRPIDLTIGARDAAEAAVWAKLLGQAGVAVEARGAEARVSGDLGAIAQAALSDSDALYRNDGGAVGGKYGLDPKAVGYGWWTCLRRLDEALLREGRFEESRVVKSVLLKAVEPAYNYHGVEVRHVGDQVGLVVGMLLFYLLYTVWYGAAIYNLCVAFGLTVGRPLKKREV
jgi:hypothetical protein